MHFRCVVTLLLCCVLVGLDWVEPMMHLNFVCHMFMHFHAYIPSILYILIYFCWYFSDCLSFYLSLSCVSLLLWHLNANLLCPKILCILGHLLPLTPLHLMFGFVMKGLVRNSWRTFVDEAFTRNATSFCRNFLTLTYP